MGSQANPEDGASTQILRHGWQFKQTDSGNDDWLPIPSIPSEVHLDLLHHSKIPDPFVGFNEVEVAWVGEKSWTYQTAIHCGTLPPKFQRTLVFEGLDTFATVSLNGKTILESSNMFLSHAVDVTTILNPGKENVLSIEFQPALLRGRELKDSHPEYKLVAINGEHGRVAVRKSQYHWGWDWGPVLMSCGPWRPIRLETYLAKVEDVWSRIELNATLSAAQGTFFAKVDGSAPRVRFTLKLASQVVLDSIVPVGKDALAKLDITLDNPKLWWPHGYGEQVLYELSAVPLDGESDKPLHHSVSKNIGFRRVKLVQEDDKFGQSFYFRVNDVDIFCGGSCWIPADNFLPRISADKYRAWLQLMVDGGQIMTRIWGGGIYEEDIFYDICDELGILVWQDFMFACGSYPTWPELLDSIRQEAACNLRRLRHHPSIVIYAGNNEDYQIREDLALKYDPLDKDPNSWLKLSSEKDTFPARYIYEHLLPQVVGDETFGEVPYWPSSPFGGVDLPSADRTVGDVHEWNVWHGTQEKYQLYETLGGRFNSEFGLEALPHLQTIKSFVTDPSDLHPHSAVLDFHNKADGQSRRIAAYLAENFRMVADIEGYIHLTQTAQADAMTNGYTGWRRQWGHDRKCGGALVWQLNDCWPVTSWAIVDYFLRKKPAYYTIARALKPIAVCVRRAHRDWTNAHIRTSPTDKVGWELWISNSNTTSSNIMVDVELRFVSVATGENVLEPVLKKGITIEPNGTTEILNGYLDLSKEPYVLAAKAIVDGQCVSRHIDWPQPLKYLSLSADRGIQVQYQPDSEGGELIVNVQRPTKALVFEERDGVKLGDSALDLIPGDEHRIQVRGLKASDKPLGWRYLGQEA